MECWDFFLLVCDASCMFEVHDFQRRTQPDPTVISTLALTTEVLQLLHSPHITSCDFKSLTSLSYCLAQHSFVINNRTLCIFVFFFLSGTNKWILSYSGLFFQLERA